jgi:hypothetical protein
VTCLQVYWPDNNPLTRVLLFTFYCWTILNFSCLADPPPLNKKNPCREGLLPILVPRVGMVFGTIEEAWMFWVGYGSLKGFELRKMYTNKRKLDGKVRLYNGPGEGKL